VIEIIRELRYPDAWDPASTLNGIAISRDTEEF